MTHPSTLPGLFVSFLILAVGCSADRGGPEQAMSLNNTGTAYLGQRKWTEAEAAFREAMRFKPDDPLPMSNTAVALIQRSRIEEAESLLRRALEIDPDFHYAHYNLALILKDRGDFEQAAGHFETVAAFDPDDVLTQYYLGLVLSRIDRDDDAEAAFRRALDLDNAHVSVLYGLGRFLLQHGDEDEGTRLIMLSQEIRARTGVVAVVGSEYGEQGPFALGIDYPGDALAAPDPIQVRFVAATSMESGQAGPPPWTLARLDGAPVLVVALGATLHRLTAEGDGGALSAPAADGAAIVGLAAGDIDNDGSLELAALVWSEGRLAPAILRSGDTGWTWSSDAHFTASASAIAESAPDSADVVFVDRDHDGDLDLFWCWTRAGAADCRLTTGDGSGSYATASAEEHGVRLDGRIEAPIRLAFSDLDNDRDVDLLVGSPDGVRLFDNLRDGTFREIAAQAGLGDAGAASLVVADMNKDGWMDLVLGGAGGVRLYRNHHGRFEAPLQLAPSGERIVVFDFDNDGFLDLARAASGGRATLYRNAGSGDWVEQAGELDAAPFAAFDADGDGDLDLAAGAGGDAPVLLLNDGGNANRWIRIDSRGLGDNTFGIGSKVEVLAGALRQKFEITSPLPLHAGLGHRTEVDSVRHLWPGGVLQDEIEQPSGPIEITQLDRKGTSCPLLYAWRDGRWRFVTDFLGGCAIGYLHEPGVFSTPDTDEYVKIVGGMATDADGLLRLRINNQLEEVIWLDKAELVVVDHPTGSQVFPNERLMPGPPWPGFALFASSDIRPVAAAHGIEDGRDLGRVLAATDRRYVDNFDLLPFKGYADDHTIELDLGPFSHARRTVLLLDGWIDYADSSANLAAHQAGVGLVPPRLFMADGNDGWLEPEHVMGFPAGLPKTMALDLTGLFPTDDHRVRIETNMRIYWDQARVMLGGEEIELRVSRLQPLEARLRFGGFPRPTSPDGRKPFDYDPQQVESFVGWKAHVGSYTALGDVRRLIADIDDRFVTTRSGDEIELRFRSPDPPTEGHDRTYLLYADGFGKDMDLNSAASNDVEPIPFHGMPTYPYGEDVAPPTRDDAEATARRVLPSLRGWPGVPAQTLAARSADPPASDGPGSD